MNPILPHMGVWFKNAQPKPLKGQAALRLTL
jgi:hypothetical protein